VREEVAAVGEVAVAGAQRGGAWPRCRHVSEEVAARG
jgi:hypothetical protein